MMLLAVILTLVLLGMFVSYIVNRYIWPISTTEDGRRPAQVRVTVGVLTLVVAWVLSIVAYMLEPSFMIDQVKGTFSRDLLFFIGILLFPSAYILGMELERYTRHRQLPPLADPIELPEDGSIIAIADTHLGLRPNYLADLWNRGADCDLHAMGTFIDWLIDETETVPVEGWPDPPPKEGSPTFSRRREGQRIEYWNARNGSVETKELLRPRYVVLLGDVLEMWDGWQESVQLAMATTFAKLNHVDPETEVVYVVGNHDKEHVWDRTPDLHTRDKEGDPAEKVEKDMRVAADSWPGPTKPWGTRMRPIKAGESEYLFVHGHQFGWWYMFASPLMFLPGLFRRAAQQGYFTWFLLLLAAGLVWFWGHFEDIKPMAIFIVALLIFLLIPITWITFARLFYSGVRYRNDKGLKHFGTWWKRVAGGSGGHNRMKRDLNLVYGHTHIMEIINKHDEKAVVVKKGKETKKRQYPWIKDLHQRYIMPQLLNLPSWVRDRRKSMDRAVFLYVDKDHHLFLGWDWRVKRPFHIPDPLIRARSKKGGRTIRPTEAGISDETLVELCWPDKFKMNRVEWTPPPEEDQTGPATGAPDETPN